MPAPEAVGRSEEDCLPLSAIAQLAYCRRRCALIHIEGLWQDNPYTVEGSLLHESCEAYVTRMHEGLLIVRHLPLRSRELGLFGIADVVEFRRVDDASGQEGAELPGLEGRWRAYPVEYKRGSPEPDLPQMAQLCAQAMCLEEMLGAPVPAGAIYFGKAHQRREVTFDDELKNLVRDLARQLHELIASGRTPPAQPSRRCRGCSLKDLCMPRTAGAGRSAERYLSQHLRRALEDGP